MVLLNEIKKGKGMIKSIVRLLVISDVIVTTNRRMTRRL